MLFLVLAPLFSVTAPGLAEDPTKICMPDVFQTEIYSLGRDISGIMAYDFTKHVVALNYTNGLRLMFNLADVSLSIINHTAGTCEKHANYENTKNVGMQCLPANAKPLTDTQTFFGLNPGGLEIQGWEFDLPNFGTVRVAITKSSPTVPVIREYTTTGPLGSDVEIFLNPKTSIDDRSIFVVPPVCPPATSVG